MDTFVCKLLFAIVVATTVAEAMNYIAFPRVGRSGYIAFPRLGRGYLAFPRLGRSGAETAEDNTSCCSLGLKNEWMMGEDGKADVQNVCPTDTACCEGLREVLDQKPDGSFYSLCIPAYSDDDKTRESTENVLRKLKGLLRN